MIPVVSIVTVSLNAAPTIGDTLKSVEIQRAPFLLEHVCVDGGSTDGTRRIIEEAASSSSKLRFLFEPDRGLFDAMNKGLKLARGQYVLFLNADDFLYGPLSIARAFAQIDFKGELPDMVMGDVVMGYPGRLGLWRMRRVPRCLPYFSSIGLHPPHQGNFIKRELLIRAGGFGSEQRLAADTTQFYKLVHEFQASMIVSRTIVSLMRMGGASNKELKSFRDGNLEVYKFVRRYRSVTASALTVLVKICQKIFEYRFGRLKSAI